MAYNERYVTIGINFSTNFDETKRDIKQHVKMLTDAFREMQDALKNVDATKGLTDENIKLFKSYKALKEGAKDYLNGLSDVQKASIKFDEYNAQLNKTEMTYRGVRDEVVAVTQEINKQIVAEKAAKKAEDALQNAQEEDLRKAEQRAAIYAKQAEEQKRLAETAKANVDTTTATQEQQSEAKLIQQRIEGEKAVAAIKTNNIKTGTTQALMSFGKIRRVWIQGIKDFFNNIKKYTNMWINILSSGLNVVSKGFKSLLSTMFSNTKSSLGGIISEFKGLLGIAGGLGLTKLGSEAIKTSNEFKTLGSTSKIIARQMSDAFYEAAGDSYNSLVKLSNGTEQVTDTLRKFINTWTGQVSLMKAQLTAIGANIGNLLTKVFYPLLVVLNKILAVVNMLIGKLASLFGFNTAKLGDILGNVGGAKAQNKGLDDYTKSANKASKATKKLADNTKKAKDNLQGYDKLNNTTTDDLDDLTDKMDDISSGGLDDIGGIFDTDKLFDNLMDELDLVPEWMKEWIDELLDLIKAGDWYIVGAHIGDLVNLGLNKLAAFLSDPSLSQKIDKLTDSLTKFANGVLDTVDWKLLGIDIAKGLNLVTYSIDSLYKSAIKNKTIDKIGDALHDTFMGFIHTIDAEQAGRAAVSAMRAIVDIVFKALDDVKDYEVNAIADRIPTIRGASILIKVTFWKKNHEIALSIVITNPKKINRLKL
jgi:hypothetical protein